MAMKECFGIELANRFFSGAYGVSTDDPAERRRLREECYNCPDMERCATVLNLVCSLRMAEEAKRSGGSRGGPRLG